MEIGRKKRGPAVEEGLSLIFGIGWETGGFHACPKPCPERGRRAAGSRGGLHLSPELAVVEFVVQAPRGQQFLVRALLDDDQVGGGGDEQAEEGPRSQQPVMFEIAQCASEILHDDCLWGYIVHMGGILSIWRLALQRGKGGSDKQEATCVNRQVAFLVLPNEA